MADKTLTLASQDQIELYEETSRRFFREVLDMDAGIAGQPWLLASRTHAFPLGAWRASPG